MQDIFGNIFFIGRALDCLKVKTGKLKGKLRFTFSTKLKSNSEACFLQPDMIAKEGYPVETHLVITDDWWVPQLTQVGNG